MEKILVGLHRLLVMFQTFWRNLLYSLENHLRARTKTVPSPIPRGRGPVIASILARPSFQTFLQQHAVENGFSREQVEANAKSYLEEIASDLNYLIMPFWETALTWFFNGIYEGFVVDEKRLDALRASIGKKPIVFVPNHRSHMDYILLSYIFYQNRFPMPIVCAGANLSFWPLGPIFRKSGAFFIRRSYEGNKLYAASVRVYIEELLRDQSVLEFFIEGTRTRSGKLLPPRMGILAAITHAYFEGMSDDVVFVPTCLTYESVLEEKSYLSEQAGGEKRTERPWDLIQIAKFFKKRSGKVYVRFGEPLSLRDWMQDVKPEERRAKTEELAFHLTYGINKSSVVTPGALVASVLLSHPKRVIAAPELYDKVEPLIDYLRFKDCQFSEPLYRHRSAAIREAIAYASDAGLIQELKDEEGIFYLIHEEKKPLLDYYKNNSVHFFVSLAVLCTLLRRAPKGKVPLNQLEDSYRLFQSLFHYEFTFSRRQPLQEHLTKLLEYLQRKDAVRVEDGVVQVAPVKAPLLSTFAVLIQNFLDGYYILWNSLPTLGLRRWEKRELLKWMLYKGHILFLKDRVRHREAVSRFILENALASFCDLGFIRQETEGWGKKKSIYYQRVKEVDETLSRSLDNLLRREVT